MRLVRAAPDPQAVRRLLVFRIGQLGDLLVALPALWYLREQFPHARITLLASSPGPDAVGAGELFAGSRVVDEILTYPSISSWHRAGELARIALALRSQGFDAAAYLAPSDRTRAQMRRDSRLFRLLGIGRVHGLSSSPQQTSRSGTGQEAQRLVERLAADGLARPRFGELRRDLALSEPERDAARARLADARADCAGEGPWIALGPAAAMPSKVWPAERFVDVVASLIERHDARPLVLGGRADRPLGDRLVASWTRGINLAGQVPPRVGAAVLERCTLYLGNDTGTMHLAASAGVECVAVFSARDELARWAPLGAGHVLLQAQVECHGCQLVECIERENACTRAILVEDVTAACDAKLSGRPRCAM